jgi:nucleotide-binding universal stress UspA family protein
MAFDRILLAHDLSETSDEALRMAVELTRRERGALTILHAYAVPVIPMPEGYVVQGPAALVELQQTIARALEKLEARAVALGAPVVRVESRTGAPADAILECARTGGFDLVVLGTHGRSGLRRVILGSVAEAVLRRAPCPVLTVHPAPEIRPSMAAS